MSLASVGSAARRAAASATASSGCLGGGGLRRLGVGVLGGRGRGCGSGVLEQMLGIIGREGVRLDWRAPLGERAGHEAPEAPHQAAQAAAWRKPGAQEVVEAERQERLQGNQAADTRDLQQWFRQLGMAPYDLGVGCADIFATLAGALPILYFGTRATGLKLNLTKVVLIRVMGGTEEHLQEILVDVGFLPLSFSIVKSGKHLGIIIGQDGHLDSWIAPTVKCISRARSIKHLALGLAKDTEEPRGGMHDVVSGVCALGQRLAAAEAAMAEPAKSRQRERRSSQGDVRLPEPIASWQDATDRRYLDQALAGKLQAAGLERPTLIQRHALPIISHQSGRYDLIASAQTGSGKTFAFVIPSVARLILQGAISRPFFAGPHAQGSPLLLLLSPTRELAVQTSKEAEVMTSGTKLVTNCVYGGESTKTQVDKITRAQTDILCATPGRLCDLIDINKLSLSFVQCCVLDEADQMLSLGLEQQVEEVFYGRDLPQPNHGRQTLLFSATMPQKIRDMTPRILRQDRHREFDHRQVRGGDQGGSCSSIRQIVKYVEDNQKMQAVLMDLQDTCGRSQGRQRAAQARS
ncbi:unnamed protein product [Prorocentrum cordatum]|uniref:Helicase ATP-binding domain-containing protein n=1 Tax=Prorocentrum cordatum TaxID=2364126 RepID=A0ABN9S985_9DINO|nr:unnamed protein product [Polarella glacialis]